MDSVQPPLKYRSVEQTQHFRLHSIHDITNYYYEYMEKPIRIFFYGEEVSAHIDPLMENAPKFHERVTSTRFPWAEVLHPPAAIRGLIAWCYGFHHNGSSKFRSHLGDLNVPPQSLEYYCKYLVDLEAIARSY